MPLFYTRRRDRVPYIHRDLPVAALLLTLEDPTLFRRRVVKGESHLEKACWREVPEDDRSPLPASHGVFRAAGDAHVDGAVNPTQVCKQRFPGHTGRFEDRDGHVIETSLRVPSLEDENDRGKAGHFPEEGGRTFAAPEFLTQIDLRRDLVAPDPRGHAPNGRCGLREVAKDLPEEVGAARQAIRT